MRKHFHRSGTRLPGRETGASSGKHPDAIKFATVERTMRIAASRYREDSSISIVPPSCNSADPSPEISSPSSKPL
jgi:hypothetical protein